MSGPPPDDLKSWSKNDLVRELRRQRAINREHANQPGHDPAKIPASGMVDVAGDPFARGGVILDTRNAVLMDAVDVSLVDTHPDEPDRPPVLALMLGGRINYRHERSQVLYMFSSDGAAAIISQLMGLAVRIGPEFAAELLGRLGNLPQPPRDRGQETERR